MHEISEFARYCLCIIGSRYFHNNGIGSRVTIDQRNNSFIDVHAVCREGTKEQRRCCLDDSMLEKTMKAYFRNCMLVVMMLIQSLLFGLFSTVLRVIANQSFLKIKAKKQHRELAGSGHVPSSTRHVVRRASFARQVTRTTHLHARSTARL